MTLEDTSEVRFELKDLKYLGMYVHVAVRWPLRPWWPLK